MNIYETKIRIETLKEMESRYIADWYEVNHQAVNSQTDEELESCFTHMKELQKYEALARAEYIDLEHQLTMLRHSPRKRITAHLENRFGVSVDRGYNYVTTWATMDAAMDEAYDLTRGRNLFADIIDRETGEILVQYENGEITYRA